LYKKNKKYEITFCYNTTSSEYIAYPYTSHQVHEAALCRSLKRSEKVKQETIRLTPLRIKQS